MFGGAMVAVLNELYSLDPAAAGQLAFARVPCNDLVADHPGIVVGGAEGGGFEVGVLGVLNGILARLDPGGPKVAAVTRGAGGPVTGFILAR